MSILQVMATDNSEEIVNSEQQVNSVMISLIKEYHVLMEKSQLPNTKDREAWTLHQAKSISATNTGKNLDENIEPDFEENFEHESAS